MDIVRFHYLLVVAIFQENIILYIGKDYSDGYERVLVSNNKTGNVEENR